MKHVNLMIVGLCIVMSSQAVTFGDDSLTPLAQTEAASDSARDAAAISASTANDWFSSISRRETLTDHWFGLGRKLSERGLFVSLGLVQVHQQNLRGALSAHRRAGRYSGRYDLEIDTDLAKLCGWSGGRVYGLARGGWSDGLDEFAIGSLFGVNAVAVGDRPIDVWQLYFEQAFLKERAFLRFGKIDLTDGFECRGCPGSFDGNSFANDEASQFLNGGLVNNPTIPLPDPGLGLMLHVEPVEWWCISAAVADADADVRETGFSTTFHGPDNFFSIFETGVFPRLPSRKGSLQGAYRIGMWYDPQPKDRLDGRGTKRDDMGFYLSFDQMVLKENADEEDSQGLGLFARYGFADSDINEIRCFWSAGAQYQGLIPGRDDDVIGFGAAQGRLSPGAGFTACHETAMELYYNARITRWLSLTPSVQYVFNPGGDRDVDNAVVVGLGVKIAF